MRPRQPGILGRPAGKDEATCRGKPPAADGRGGAGCCSCGELRWFRGRGSVRGGGEGGLDRKCRIDARWLDEHMEAVHKDDRAKFLDRLENLSVRTVGGLITLGQVPDPNNADQLKAKRDELKSEGLATGFAAAIVAFAAANKPAPSRPPAPKLWEALKEPLPPLRHVLQEASKKKKTSSTKATQASSTSNKSRTDTAKHQYIPVKVTVVDAAKFLQDPVVQVVVENLRTTDTDVQVQYSEDVFVEASEESFASATSETAKSILRGLGLHSPLPDVRYFPGKEQEGSKPRVDFRFVFQPAGQAPKVIAYGEQKTDNNAYMGKLLRLPGGVVQADPGTRNYLQDRWTCTCRSATGGNSGDPRGTGFCDAACKSEAHPPAYDPTPTPARDPEHVSPVVELYTYMREAGMRYGILTCYLRWWFFFANDDSYNLGVVQIDSHSTTPSVAQVLVAFLVLAKNRLSPNQTFPFLYSGGTGAGGAGNGADGAGGGGGAGSSGPPPSGGPNREQFMRRNVGPCEPKKSGGNQERVERVPDEDLAPQNDTESPTSPAYSSSASPTSSSSTAASPVPSDWPRLLWPPRATYFPEHVTYAYYDRRAGEGSRCSVWRSTWPADGSLCVVKLYDGIDYPKGIRLVAHEGQMYDRMRSIQGTCVPRCLFRGAMSSGWQFSIITSFEGESLPEDDSYGRYLCAKQRYPAAVRATAIEALRQVHVCGVLHDDIRAANLVLSEDGKRIKLIDFGYAQVCDDAESFAKEMGRLEWVLGEAAVGEDEGPNLGAGIIDV